MIEFRQTILSADDRPEMTESSMRAQVCHKGNLNQPRGITAPGWTSFSASVGALHGDDQGRIAGVATAPEFQGLSRLFWPVRGALDGGWLRLLRVQPQLVQD